MHGIPTQQTAIDCLNESFFMPLSGVEIEERIWSLDGILT